MSHKRFLDLLLDLTQDIASPQPHPVGCCQALDLKCLTFIRQSEGFPERDIWFLGALDQGSTRCPELLGCRCRRRHLEAIEVQL